MNADVVVIGAGTAGAAIAFGLASRNVTVLVLDGGDQDFRAATANFGLVWLQGKGIDMPEYQRLTREAVELWPNFCAELEDAAAIDVQFERRGGLAICLGEAEFEARRAKMRRLQSQRGAAKPDWEMIDRTGLAKLLPHAALGADVTGASFGYRDGHANPLRLLAALHAGIVRKGGAIKRNCAVRSVRLDRRSGFDIDFGSGRASAGRVVIAAGLGSRALAAQVGLDIPIRPQRGQILVTERLAPFLPLPIYSLRQTPEGTVMIGATHEDAGFDTSTTCSAAASLSARAIRFIPALSEVKLVRQWAGLRIMTPDSYPIYVESESHPGAYVATCHSGVTLAPWHASAFADAVLADRLSPTFDAFHYRRFDVPKAA